MIDSLTVSHGDIEHFGNPWHGRFVDSSLVLPSGHLRPASCPKNAPDTWLVRFPGIPAPETTPDQAAMGMEWRNDAVLYTCEKRYSPDSPAGLGYLSWLWRSPQGEVWRLRLQFNYAHASVAVGDGTTTGATVYASRFGLIGAGAAVEHVVLSTGMSWTNRGPNQFVVVPHLSHSPTGARTAITFRTGPVGRLTPPTAITGRVEIMRTLYASALFELVVTGTDESGRPTVSLSVVVGSAAAQEPYSEQSSPGPITGAQSVDVRLIKSTLSTDDGVTSVVGISVCEAGSIQLSDVSTGSSRHLVCGVYGADEDLRQVWYEVERSSNWVASAPTGGVLATVDQEYSYTGSSEGRVYLRSTIQAPGFEYHAHQQRTSTTTLRLLLDQHVVSTLTSESVTHENYTCTFPGISSSDDPDTWPSIKSLFMESLSRVTDMYIDGVMVISGFATPNEQRHDEIRSYWTSFRPVALSNNLFAIGARDERNGDTFVTRITAASGDTLEVEPQNFGTYGALAAASWDPRSNEIICAANAVNGFV